MRNVLLVASLSERYYFDPFLEACEHTNLHLYLLDPSRFLSEMVMGVVLENDGKLSGFVEVLDLSGTHPEKVRLSVSDIDVAWYIREGPAGSTVEESSLEERFVRNESRGALRSFFSTLACTWINHPETMDGIASNKLFQQQVARRVGLMTPMTLLSNDPGSVVSFSSQKNGLLLKSIGYTKLDDEGQYFLYSQRISHQEIKQSASAIRRCPVFSQEYVEKRYEHRVMVIGNRILSCRIDSQASEATRVDWRHYDFGNVEHLQVELPHETKKQLLQFMDAIGLKYGAIDLIETPNGNFVFLEVNPSGQWGWIADLAGLPIPEAVAEMLAFL